MKKRKFVPIKIERTKEEKEISDAHYNFWMSVFNNYWKNVHDRKNAENRL